MAKIEWDENLSVGIEILDEQHREWINHYNKTVKAVSELRGEEEIPNELNFLIDYTNSHFDTEENLMELSQYPDITEHKEHHTALKKTLKNLTEELEEEGPTPLLSESLDIFLGNWLIKHIQEVDKKLGAYLIKQKS